MSFAHYSVALLPMVQLVFFAILLLRIGYVRAQSESFTFGFTMLAVITSIACAAWVGIETAYAPHHIIFLPIGAWFGVGHQHFTITWLVDPLSVTYLVFTLVLVSTIAVFSRRYLHKEAGFHRFYCLLMLFMLGITVASLAASLDVMLIGWELVGLASILLVSFFNYRAQPVRSSLWVCSIYRLTDLGIIAAMLILHHSDHHAHFAMQEGALWATLHPTHHAVLIGSCLLFATMGKSALFPFSGWLPRAMEGPTPSSAIFYGAVSVHLGALLMLRIYPVIAEHAMLSTALLVIGALTALMGAWVGYRQTDIKTVMAYGSIMQLGMIMVEIGAGFPLLALVHCVGHGFFRTLHILRAPNLIAERQHVDQMLGEHVLPTISPFITQPRLAWIYYRIGLERGLLDALLLRVWAVVAMPVRLIQRCEHSLIPNIRSAFPRLHQAQQQKNMRRRTATAMMAKCGFAVLYLGWHHMHGSIVWSHWLLVGCLGGFAMIVRFMPAWEVSTRSIAIILGCCLVTSVSMVHPLFVDKMHVTLPMPLLLLFVLPPCTSLMQRLFMRVPLAIAASISAAIAGLLFFGISQESTPDLLMHSVLAFGAVCASVQAIMQTSPRRALALLVVSQCALIAYALSYPNQGSHIGGDMMLFTFFTATIGFIMCIAAVEARTPHAMSMLKPSGHYASMPHLAGLMLIFGVISTGLPISTGFMAEELILGGTFAQEPWIACAWLASISLNAVCVLRMWLYTTQGNAGVRPMMDACFHERATAACVMVLIMCSTFFAG
ncbi:MAG: hypothetical protein EAZ52_07345 [Alphaproteobacteria bacterium]|nr:MAG: hypothetical protein EAZ52_07345 [Alphaproteobacteria bacterium]